jgi:cell wall assembly regulator SMI1
MSIDDVLRAWRLSAHLHTFQPGATERELRAAEEALGCPLPADLAALYAFSNGADLLAATCRCCLCGARATRWAWWRRPPTIAPISGRCRRSC